MFQTIVHQTLRDDNNADHIENNGPFSVEDIEQSYLGSGYYFWDDHIELAHWWGQKRIKGRYVICQGELKISKELFFDLVGCRQDQKHFKDVIERFGFQNKSIGTVIELLKNVEKKPNFKGIFPYKVIRAMDVSDGSYAQEYKKFVSSKKGRANLTPQMIICLIEKNKVVLPTYKIIHPEEYIQ